MRQVELRRDKHEGEIEREREKTKGNSSKSRDNKETDLETLERGMRGTKRKKKKQ